MQISIKKHHEKLNNKVKEPTKILSRRRKKTRPDLDIGNGVDRIELPGLELQCPALVALLFPLGPPLVEPDSALGRILHLLFLHRLGGIGGRGDAAAERRGGLAGAPGGAGGGGDEERRDLWRGAVVVAAAEEEEEGRRGGGGGGGEEGPQG